jgi:hypothetical protein
MNRQKVKDLVIEQVNPEELIDVLGLNTEQLLYHLSDIVDESVSNGHFDYLLIMNDEHEESEQT